MQRTVYDNAKDDARRGRQRRRLCRAVVLGIVSVIALALAVGCGDTPAGAPQPDSARADVAAATDTSTATADAAVDTIVSADTTRSDSGGDGGGRGGTFEVLTYNVAGLPAPLSKSSPEKNSPLISPLLNHFDLVFLQEDFAYTHLLRAAAKHPYQSPPQPAPTNGPVMNDGLNHFANFKNSGLSRVRWVKCNGLLTDKNDCLASKGYSVAEMTLTPGVTVDVYNLHMDAGQSGGDYDARAAQVKQLIDAIAARSKNRAVIIAGDFNLKLSASVDNKGLLQQLLQQAQLTDACLALSCGDPRYDRVMYRSSPTVELAAESWLVDGRFVDGDGKPLSDHEAVAVGMRWTLKSSGN